VGDDVLVGAPHDDVTRPGVKAGAVSLFDGSTGALLHTFRNPTPDLPGGFGFSVAGLGGNVLVGAPLDDYLGPNRGAVYLFDGGTGNLLHSFLNPTPADSEFFGVSIAGVGGNALVGAPGDSTGPGGTVVDDAGAAYLFDGSTGNLLHTFLNPTPALGDGFGDSVARFGSNFLVGAPGDDTGGLNHGAVYLFDGGTGALLQTFLATVSNPPGSFRLGGSVAEFGGNVLAGSGGGSANGGVYLFDGSTGALLQRFYTPTPDFSNAFGVSVAVAGSNFLVGDPGKDTVATNVGAAYLFGRVATVDADVNGDSDIDADDVAMIRSLMGLTVSCGKPEMTCHADVDNDLDIDATDVALAESQQALPIPWDDPDVDGDSDTDVDDVISVYLHQFTASCPWPEAYKAHMDVDQDCDIDLDDLISTFLLQFKPWPP